MRLSYAHRFTNRNIPRDMTGVIKTVEPELEEIGGWSKGEVQEAVIRLMRWCWDDNTVDIAVKIEVFRGESISMVTASGDGFVIGWESKK